MEELKSCPFCGSNVFIRKIGRSSQGDERSMRYKIECDNCHIHGFYFETKISFENDGKVTVDETERTEAIEKWNRRVNNA